MQCACKCHCPLLVVKEKSRGVYFSVRNYAFVKLVFGESKKHLMSQLSDHHPWLDEFPID